MKILLLGATGRTGKEFISLATEQGHHVIAYARNPISIEENKNITVVKGELNNTELLKTQIKNVDAIVSVLGGKSLSKHSDDIISGIKTITSIVRKEKNKRFIYLSSIGAGNSKYYMGTFMRFLICNVLLRVPLADHTINEKQIEALLTNWTVVRPGGLTDKPFDGKYISGSNDIELNGNPKLSRANVAGFILDELKQSNYRNKKVWLKSS